MNPELYKILVIDDEAPMRHMLRMVLERDGYTVSEAASGSQGLDRLRSGHFGLILCDIRMPRMDGLEFLERAKNLGCSATIIVFDVPSVIPASLMCLHGGSTPLSATLRTCSRTESRKSAAMLFNPCRSSNVSIILSSSTVI